MLSEGATFINVERMDMKHQAAKPAEAKALMDYLLYHEHNPKKALELGAEATKLVEYVTESFTQPLSALHCTACMITNDPINE
jgi:hypothetical protein